MNAPVWLKYGLVLGACTVALHLGARTARAEDAVNHLYDKFQASVSGSILRLGSEARIDARDGSIGTDIDLEDDLGFTQTKFQPRAELRWQPGRRHHIDVGYQMARRTASKSLERDIALGDTSFTAGAEINSVFDSDNAFLTYRYVIVAKENTQFGVGLGLGAFFFKVGVDALAGISSGGSSRTVDYSSETSFIGPTSALGLFGRFRLGDRWYVNPDARYLRVSIDRFTGQVVEGGVGAQYYTSPKFGIEAGLGIRAIKVDVGPKTDGGFGPDVSARVEYRESQFHLGVLFPL